MLFSNHPQPPAPNHPQPQHPGLFRIRYEVRGGKLKARKGVNVPTVQIDCAALTEKDVEDMGPLTPKCPHTWVASFLI